MGHALLKRINELLKRIIGHIKRIHTKDDIAEILPHLFVSRVRTHLPLLCTVLNVGADEFSLSERVSPFELDLDPKCSKELQVLVMACI